MLNPQGGSIKFTRRSIYKNLEVVFENSRFIIQFIQLKGCTRYANLFLSTFLSVLQYMIDWSLFGVKRHFQQYFSYIMATSVNGGRSRSTRREPPIMGKQLVNVITCAASRVHLFCNIQSRTRPYAVLVIGLYELLCNPAT